MSMEKKISSQLQLVFQTGLNSEGTEVFARKNYNNVNPESEAASVHAVALVLSELRDDHLTEAFRNDQSILLAE
ncbi:DUF1659 domain-containing protein [Halalkalibacillus halophilus]|uniref:DUF1659 domain-containing protein n=1 Tax=Halalkalibacillus halophilus TaxID=392827 RepID=UPI0003F923E6|nr:DUF1659 domain-containing protein [Halalkalibacillus halophilus]